MSDPQEILDPQEAPAPLKETALAAVPPEPPAPLSTRAERRVSELMDAELKRMGRALKMDAICLGRVKEWASVQSGVLDMMKQVRKRMIRLLSINTFNNWKLLEVLATLFFQLNAEYRKQRELYIRTYKALKEGGGRQPRAAASAKNGKPDIFEKRRLRNEASGNGEPVIEPKRARFALAPKP